MKSSLPRLSANKIVKKRISRESLVQVAGVVAGLAGPSGLRKAK